MSRSVKFRREAPPSHYERPRSDSGFSDCESRTPNTERDYLGPGYEDHGLYTIRQTLETTRQESEQWRAKAEELEEKLKETRNEFEQTKAHMRALSNETQVRSAERDALCKANKDLANLTTQLFRRLRELEEAKRKGGNGPSASDSTATTSEWSDEKERTVRHSSSKRPKDRTDNEAKKRSGHRKARKREKERLLEETERLPEPFGTCDDDDSESDAQSNSALTKSQRSYRESDIELVGPSASSQDVSYPATPPPRLGHSTQGSGGLFEILALFGLELGLPWKARLGFKVDRSDKGGHLISNM